MQEINHSFQNLFYKLKKREDATATHYTSQCQYFGEPAFKAITTILPLVLNLI